MPRLTLLLPNLGGGGAERVTLSLAEKFIARGHEVNILLLQAKGELVEQVPAGARLFDLGVMRIRSAIAPLIRYMRAERPAALQASMWPLTAAAIVAARLSRTRTRVVVTDHSVLSTQYAGSRRTLAGLRLTTRFIYPFADARICVSEGSATDLAAISGLPRSAFSVIHNPVARPDSPLERNPEVEALWSGAEKRILSVGNLKAAKNHELLIRAFAILKTQISAKLLIVGEGDLRPSLKQLIDDLGLSEQVVLTGFASDPWPFYASADLFVLSSNREGFPGALMEAMIAGLPVVSTDCKSGPREILDGGKFGQLVPVGNADALSAAMIAALTQKHDPGPAREQALRLSNGSADSYLRLMLGPRFECP